ncbi:MAG: NAD-dependent epimerase/dehydratase family protein [Microbacteriaceae bacterium]
MARQKVLITGADGFIGRTLLERYRSLGIPVIGVDLRGDGADVHAGDTGNPQSFAHLLDDCDTVIHTAALVSNAMADSDMWRVNVLATSKLIDAAATHGVRRFVHVSSIVVYGNSATGQVDETRPVHADGGSYVLTKLASEHVVLSAHAQGRIEVVVVRPGDVYGPGCRPWVSVPLQLIRSRQFLLPAGGEAYFRPTYVDDLVGGIVSAAQSKAAAGECINLSCDGYVTTREFFSHHYRWLGQRGPIGLPTGVAWSIAEGSFQVKKLFGVRSEGSGASIEQLTSRAWFANDKAQRLLDWRPQTSLEDGMQRTREWAETQGLLK